MTVARRCAGELIRNSSLAKISSLPGMVASAFTSSTFSTLPSTMPSLNWNSAFSPTHLAKPLASATGSPEVKATALTPLRPFSAPSTFVPSPEIAASLFFTTRYLPPASRITLRSAKSWATVSLAKVPMIAVVEVSSSLASS